MKLIDTVPEQFKKDTEALFVSVKQNLPLEMDVIIPYKERVGDFLDLLSLKYKVYVQEIDMEEFGPFSIIRMINYIMNFVDREFINRYPKEFVRFLDWDFDITNASATTYQIHPSDDRMVEFTFNERGTVDFSMRGIDIFEILDAVLNAEDEGTVTSLKNREVVITPKNVYNGSDGICVISPNSAYKVIYKDKEDRFLGEDTPSDIWKVMQVCYSGEDEGLIVEHYDAVIMSKNIYQRMADVFDFLKKVEASDAIWPLKLDNTTYLVATAEFMQKEYLVERTLLDKFLNIYKQMLDLNEEVDKYMKGERPR